MNIFTAIDWIQVAKPIALILGVRFGIWYLERYLARRRWRAARLEG